LGSFHCFPLVYLVSSNEYGINIINFIILCKQHFNRYLA
jgi:hypothetical protein